MIEGLIKSLKGNIKDDKLTTYVGVGLLLISLSIYIVVLFIETKTPLDINFIWALIAVGLYLVVTKKGGLKNGDTDRQ